MLKRAISGTIVLTVAIGGIGVGGYAVSPAFRAECGRRVAQLTGWTEEARQADPVGFSDFARQRLERDLGDLQEIRRELAAEIGQLAHKIREQEALRDQAKTLSEEFRDQHQQASTGEDYPVMVRLAAYTEDQVKSQVSMLLAEAEGYERALSGLQEVKQEAETKLESLVVSINETEAQLAALSTKRELLKIRLLSDEGEVLLAQVDDLLNGNTQLIDGNPVRTVRELLQSPSQDSEQRVANTRVDEFLAQKPIAKREGKAKPQKSQVDLPSVSESDDVAFAQETFAKPPKAPKKDRSVSKPIFQQF